MSDISPLQQIADRIQGLRSVKAVLLRVIDTVEQDLQEAQAKHGKLVNECTPLYKLPHELLADIFHKCQDMWLATNSKHPFEVVASCVSSHWRAMALGTPLLWSNIFIHITSRNNRVHHAQRLVAYLTRSGSCFLDISLRIDVPLQDISQFINLLVAHAHRWHRVSIFLPHCSINDVFAPLSSIAAPALIHLSLRVGSSKGDPNSPRTEYPSISPPILTGGSPSLSFIRVAGVVVGNLEPPLSAVTTLHIDAWPRNVMTQSQFQAMFKSLPCLINLSLTGLNIRLPRDPLHVSLPTPIPTLRSLRIRGKATPCYRFLSLLTLPHLESLSLHGVDTFDSVSLPTLRSLSLDSSILSEDDLTNMLRVFPGISTFSVDHSVPQKLILSRMVDNELWPYLEAVTLRQLAPDDAAPFCLVCLGRSGDKGRLRRVQMDKRTRNVLKAKGYLDIMRQIVTLERCEHIDPWPSGLGYEDPDDDWDY